jgi:hypothetical protein
VLLLLIGLTGIWPGVFHVFLPGTASAAIGWDAGVPFYVDILCPALAIAFLQRSGSRRCGTSPKVPPGNLTPPKGLADDRQTPPFQEAGLP